jgi:hypothetical protein
LLPVVARRGEADRCRACQEKQTRRSYLGLMRLSCDRESGLGRATTTVSYRCQEIQQALRSSTSLATETCPPPPCTLILSALLFRPPPPSPRISISVW